MPSLWTLAVLTASLATAFSLPHSPHTHNSVPSKSWHAHTSTLHTISHLHKSALPSASAIPKTRLTPIDPGHLNRLAQAHGKLWFGTATNVYGSSSEATNTKYMSLLDDKDMFGQLTPINVMKFAPTEPQQNVFNYTLGDKVIALARVGGDKYVRCHTLIWHQDLPEWLTRRQNWTAAELTSIMETHIRNLVTHWGGSCYSWDVVNEALLDDGSLRPNIWHDTIGADYIALAYQFAAAAVAQTNSSIKLYYNDYGIEHPSRKTAAAVALVQKLQSRGIRIDGVALESHFTVGSTPSATQQVAAMESFTALGLDVVRSEMDVGFASAAAHTDAGLAVQKQDYYDTVASCMAVARCVGMTVWDFDGAYSWLRKQGGADILDSNLNRKAAFYGVSEAILGMPCQGCRSAL